MATDQGTVLVENADRATVYRVCSTGWTKREERDVSVHFVRYAQIPRAVRLQGIAKGARKPAAHVFHDGQAILVLAGWGHPDVPKVPEGTSIVAWDADNDQGFSAQLDAHVAKTGAVVLADLRHHNPRAVA